MKRAPLLPGLLLAAALFAVPAPASTREGSASERLARAVTEGAPGALPVAFEAFARGVAKAADGSAVPLGASEREAIAQALVDAPRDALRAHLRGVSAAGAFEDRRAGLLLLAAGGEADDLRTACELTLDEAGSADRRLLRQLERTLADIVAREPTGVAAAVDLLNSAKLPVHMALVRAVGSSKTEEAATELLRIVQRESPMRLIALTELGRLLSAGLGRGDDRIVLALRRLVDDADPAIQREALLSLGRVGDEATIPRMIALLESPHAGLRGNAYWALQELTGLPFTSDARRWKTWYAQEEAWWAGPAQDLLRGLQTGGTHETVAALKAFAQHRLFRHLLAEQVAGLLHSDDPRIVVLACYSLRQLGSGSVAPELLRVLDHGDETVREAARTTLSGLEPRSSPAAGSGAPHRSPHDR